MRKGLNCYKMNETDRAYLIDIFHRKKTIYALGLLISFLAHTQTYGQITSQKVDSLVKTAMTKFNVVGTARHLPPLHLPYWLKKARYHGRIRLLNIYRSLKCTMIM